MRWEEMPKVLGPVWDHMGVTLIEQKVEMTVKVALEGGVGVISG